jgi:hypothetical protein
MLKHLSTFLLLATMAMPGYSQVYGSLANFDVVNDTGTTAHGFEIDIRDIHSGDITSIFGSADRWPDMERYGSPSVTEYTDAAGFGVKITYKSAYGNGAWSVGTPSGTLPVSPSDSCWPYGAPAYGPDYPCDHFGVSTSVGTPNVTYSWLVETPGNLSVLTPVVATVPNPVWTVTPVPPVANVPQPPQVNVAIAAPQPQNYEFGEPRWVKVTATGTLQDVAVEDLVAENAIIQQARTQTQLEWQLIQVDAGNPGSGQIDLTGVQLDEGAAGVVYRFEYYQYTGNRDAETNEAKPGPNGDTPGAIGPSPGDLGEFIVAQNAGINFDGVIPPAPPLPIAPTLNATIGGATVGSPYYQVIDATPGNPGDALSITVAGLPAGLTFDSAANAIVGTPTVVGTFPLTITVTDIANGLSTTGTTDIQVADAAIVFNLTLNQGTVGVAYSQQLSVTGGYGTITYAVFGSLPDGLSLTGDTLGGTPVTAGSTPVTVTATDALGYSQVATATLNIVAAPVIDPPPPPPVPVACSGTNQVISSVNKFWLDIAGGVANGGQSVYYAPEAATTFVPPLAFGVFQFGQLVTYDGTLDNMGFCVATTMTVAPGLSMMPVTLINGTVGSAYPSTAVTPAGGVAPYTITVGGLPSGMTFDGANIAGTPALGTEGTVSVSISVNDAIGETVNTTLSLTIDPPAAIVVGAVNLPATGVYGAAYSGSAAAGGGVGALTWTATGLPAGVSISPTGAISGTPMAVGTFAVVLTVKDTLGQTATVNGSVVISAPAITAFTANLPAVQVGTAYSATLSASGGYGAFTYSATGLPAGLTLTGNTISGTPTGAGIFPVTLTATDGLGTVATLSQTLTVTDFTVTATSASQTVKRGSSVSNTVTIGALYGFGNTVSLSVGGLPKNAKATFTPSSVTGAGSSVLKVTAAKTTPRGKYTLTITGQSGTLAHTKTVTLSVQ